jgi:hypothetical protein
MDEQELPELISLDWVFQRVKSSCHVVGLSCEGFEEQMMVLFTEIETSRNQNGVIGDSKFCSKLEITGKNRELKRLVCSINYVSKGGHSNGDKGKRGVIVCLMKPKILSCNVRGLNEKDKRMRIRGLITN